MRIGQKLVQIDWVEKIVRTEIKKKLVKLAAC